MMMGSLDESTISIEEDEGGAAVVSFDGVEVSAMDCLGYGKPNQFYAGQLFDLALLVCLTMMVRLIGTRCLMGILTRAAKSEHAMAAMLPGAQHREAGAKRLCLLTG